MMLIPKNVMLLGRSGPGQVLEESRSKAVVGTAPAELQASLYIKLTLT